jgi:ribose transport system permease protein
MSTMLRAPAAPAFAGAVAVWIATWLVAGHGLWGTLSGGVAVATFLVIVGIGQMFVITSGNGGIDLSVPYVMTLSAYLTSQAMAGQNSRLIAGVAVALAIGLVIGSTSSLLIELVGIPPLVATLAVGFLAQTAILVNAGSASGASGVPSPALDSFVSSDVGPFPVFALFGIALTGLFTVVLKATRYGRQVEAVGQSPIAARLAGIDHHRVRAIAYVISAVTAAFAGMFLAAYSGGASIGMGTPYLLSSIAAVVLGGSLIVGGRSTVPGVWAAAVLLTLLITLVNVAKISGGMEYVVEGALIILVLSFTSTVPRRA